MATQAGWITLLVEAPASLTRAIARAQGVSLPHRLDRHGRAERLVAAIAPVRVVRHGYHALDSDAQAALAELIARRGRLPAALVERQLGPVRPWRQLRADPRPRSLAERLMLMGWLIPRPASPRHPAGFLLPLELRRRLPRVADVADRLDLGLAPATVPAPAPRAAVVVLLAAAERPIARRASGLPRRAAVRRLAERLGPAVADPAPLIIWVCRCLVRLGLLAEAPGQLTLTADAVAYLRLPPADRLERLRQAWLDDPAPDPSLGVSDRAAPGLAWPALRRRLVAWTEALPLDRALPVAGRHAALAGRLGPLADAQTHPYRVCHRTPWTARTAEAVLRRAWLGPLAWLGWTTAGRAGEVATIARPATPRLPDPDAAWRAEPAGAIVVPHGAQPADTLALLPHARWLRADADADVYTVDRHTVAAGLAGGAPPAALAQLLERRLGQVPASLAAPLAAVPAAVRLLPGPILVVDPPSLLARLAESRGVRAALADRPGPGVAVVARGAAGRLRRALTHRGVPCRDLTPPPAPPAPATPRLQLDAADAAALCHLLAVCRRRLPDAEGLLPLDLLPRLAPFVPPAVLAACQLGANPADDEMRPVPGPPRFGADAAPCHDVDPGSDRRPETAVDAANATPATWLPTLRRLAEAGAAVRLRYLAANAAVPSVRVVRPLAVEARAGGYLHAFCQLRQAARTFRLDRIVAVEPLNAPGPHRPPGSTPVPG